jgi:hypothetical protein
MATDIPLHDLLRCAIQVVGRIAMRPEQVGEVLAAKVLAAKVAAKQLKAYNLCDGTKTQGEVAKAAGLDAGNFSRTASRWVNSGVLFKIGSGRDARLLHLYPLAKSDVRKRKTVGKGKAKGNGARKRRAR